MWTIFRVLLTDSVRPCSIHPKHLLGALCRHPSPLQPCCSINRDHPGVMSAQPEVKADVAESGHQLLAVTPPSAPELTGNRNSPTDSSASQAIQQGETQVKQSVTSPTRAVLPNRDSPKRKATDDRRPWSVSPPRSQQQAARDERGPSIERTSGGSSTPLQKSSPKRKRQQSESAVDIKMSGNMSHKSPAAENRDREALQTAAMKLMAALKRAGERSNASSELNGAQRTGQGSQQTGPKIRQQEIGTPGTAQQQRGADTHRLQNGAQSKQKPQVSGEEMLENVRIWEPVASAGRPPRQPPPGAGPEFTMVSYNVLSQHLYDLHPELYVGAQRDQTDWAVRAPRLWDQLTRFGADIVCLQEVEERDLQTFWIPRCRQEGFNIIFKKRTGKDKMDGCALMFRESVFTLQDVATVEYMQPDCKALDRDNVGIVARLSGAGGELAVACTHLLYNPRRHDVKLAQVALLLAELDRLAWCGSRQTYLPILLAGDLNLEPHSPVYQFLTRGWLQYAGMTRRQLTPFGGGETLLGPLLPPQLGVTAYCRHVGVQMRRLYAQLSESEPERRRAERHMLAVRHSEHRHVPPPLPLQELTYEASAGFLAHGLQLRSVYRHGQRNKQEVTTQQREWITVDYIFQSVSPPPGSARLELTSRFVLPTAAVCRKLQPYPSAALPSDHLPLAARFRLVPPR
ncbi:protein angel homolog 2-like [Amphibalanus amphitrite]|uniref:protein angel homolog 2-like n=1 Tax=Amphibalanus amphitrite TaxID=1232801 RepID=UPI001C921713|nr:protein angel homolog 2-like [Amphibalanus amphitrite]